MGASRAVIAIGQAGDLDRAEALARGVTNPEDEALALAGLATVAAQAGDLDRANQLVTDAEILARDITDREDRAEVLGELVTSIAQTGDLSRAARLLSKVLLMDTSGISWIESMSQFFPSGIGDTWDILASMYMTRV